jgi:AAA family ATP:ADP antiporter
LNAKTRLEELFGLRRGELVPLAWAASFFFFLLAGYYVLRPLRDEMAIRVGPERLHLLNTGTLVGMLLAVPAFAWLVARTPRRVFIPLTYRFFALNVAAFWALFTWSPPGGVVWVEATYFVWVSVFNLFAVSVLWGFMGEVFRFEQSKRLYGLIGLGGTLGAIAGSQMTAGLVGWLAPVQLFGVAIVCFELAVQCMRRLDRLQARAAGDAAPVAVRTEPERRPGGVFRGLRLVFERPYLRVLCVYLFLQTICAQVLYYQQSYLVKGAIADSAGRTAYFASVNLYSNLLTLVLQTFVTSRLLTHLGVTWTLLILPAIGLMGFGFLGLEPTLGTVMVLMVVTKGCEHAVAKPARETLYTLTSRAEKFQSKSFIDTVVYRGGDALAGWTFNGVRKAFELPLPVIAWGAAPLAAAWLGTSWVFGRKLQRLAKDRTDA